MKNTQSSWLSAVCAGILATTLPASALYSGAALAEEAEKIVVTGSRRAVQTGGDTLTPLDVISGNDFSRQATGELDSMLRTVLPAYNVNSAPILDAATFIRPANLRGLAPDHTLILVNGKRRHRGAVVALIGGGVSNSSQGVDIGAIPSIGIERIEVLRDGAAAQYGSDAIAGVLNFIMKDSSEGSVVDTKVGSSYAGDGEQRQFATNMGLPVGDDGSLNISLEWVDKNPTVRSVVRPDAQALRDAGNTDVRDPYTNIWGQPDLDDDIRTAFNFEMPLDATTEVYAFGNYSERTSVGGFYYRHPDERQGVFVRTTTLGDLLDEAHDLGSLENRINDDETVTVDGEEIAIGAIPVVARLIGDRGQTENAGNPENSGDRVDCPLPLFVTTHSATNTEALHLAYGGEAFFLEAQAAAQAALDASDDCWTYNDFLPGGFTPQFGGEITDYSFITGVKGETDGGWTYDASVSVGESEIKHFMESLNASLGLNDNGTAQRDFGDLGTAIQTDTAANLDLTYPLDVAAFASPLNVALGFEWREEQFEVVRGAEASYLAGPYIYQGFSAGSNGFNGYSPGSELNEDRSNIAIYVDLEADVTDRLTLETALRWEDFQQFGTDTNWKVSGLYHLTDSVRVRASANTGFRVPTVGQTEATSIVTTITNGQLASQAAVAPDSPLAQAFGGGALSPEESDSYTIGIIFDIGEGELTMDFFEIDVSDRLSRSQQFMLADLMNGNVDELTDDEVEDLLARSGFGNLGSGTLEEVQFNINDFDTKTRGLDIVYRMPVEITETGTSDLHIAGNWTKTWVERHNPQTLDELRRRQIEETLPNLRANVTLTHDEGDWRGLVRARYFGNGHEFQSDSLPGSKYGAELLWDVEVIHSPMPQWEMVIGAENIFDNNPDSKPGTLYRQLGAKYPEAAPSGLLGGFYYAGVRYEW